MAKKKIIFRLTAFSAAAGKYNPEAPLDGNEDNFYVDDDLNDEVLGRFQTDVDVAMSDCGCLMVVADGMGGMNAGEVASELAIETVKDFFAPGKITPKMAESPIERRRYLELVIKEADRRIKTDAKENPAHEGMGSTIILAWIVGDKLTLSWCGDSRAYRYNPINGLEPLSRDHSYVQELVNQGALTYEDTFEHPQGNIVTRSLGDPNNSAKPETKQFDVYNEDIILLCSDGLSGVLRDRKTKDPNGNFYPGENIEDIIAAHTSSMTECRDALLAAAEKADWYDNVTVLLCQIESGAEEAPKKEFDSQDHSDNEENNKNKSLKTRIFLGAGGILLLVSILCAASYYLGIQKGVAEKTEQDDLVAQNDSTSKKDVVPEDNVVQGVEIADSNFDVEKSGIVESGDKSSKNAGENNWKADLISKLDKISEPSWKETRITQLKNEIRNAPEKNRNSLTTRVNDLITYNNYLNQVRGLYGKLNNSDQQVAEGLEKKILDHKISPQDCKTKIEDLKNRIKNYDKELTDVTEVGGSDNDNPQP